jgi:hypothetical protein
MRRKFFFLFGLAAICAMTLTSCKDKCKDVNCGINGNCDSETGDCVCNLGYEGTNCETTWSSKFVSATGWSASDNTTASTAGTPLGIFTYVPTISAGAADRVVVAGMSGFADSVIDLNLGGSTVFTISDTDAAGRIYAGSGSISADGSTITVSYTVTYSDSTSDTISASWSKN